MFQNFSHCGRASYQDQVAEMTPQRQLLLLVEDFIYDLPSSRIAMHPAEPRDSSRLCVITPEGRVDSQHRFRDLGSLVPPHSLLVFNDSAVFPARLQLAVKGRQLEILLLALPKVFQSVPCMVKPGKLVRPSLQLTLAEDVEVMVERVAAKEGPPDQPDQRDAFVCTFRAPSQQVLWRWLEQHGHTPLPPYIARPAMKADGSRYQTVYAQHPQSSAAPTAGLHFSTSLMAELAHRGIECVFLQLAVGAGTFLPVKTSQMAQHVMHRESYVVPATTLDRIAQAQQEHRSVIAVGTTTVRALESLAQLAGRDRTQARLLTDHPHDSDLFITPQTPESRYQPWLCDGIITNFHAPRSTLLMMVSALMGYHTVRRLYHHALCDEQIRFLSYGDASLLMWQRY